MPSGLLGRLGLVPLRRPTSERRRPSICEMRGIGGRQHCCSDGPQVGERTRREVTGELTTRDPAGLDGRFEREDEFAGESSASDLLATRMGELARGVPQWSG